MKKLLIILFLTGCLTSVFAQSSNLKASKRDQIEAQKVSYITTILNLTPEEAQKFWPLYNEYQDKLNKQRKEGKRIEDKLREGDEDISDPELDKLMKDRFARQHAKIDLDEEYYEKYKKVLPPSKVAAFYRAERSFKRELLNRLREKPGGARPQ